jgi:ABC-type tungstate transport system permease subunit
MLLCQAETVELTGALGLAFQAQSGIAVRPAAVDPKDLEAALGRVDALLIPERLEPTALAGLNRRPVLISDVVLIGPRGDRARVRGMRDRRGLEVLVSGDPALRTRWLSVLARPGSAGVAWHDWLSSEVGQAAIAGFRLKGVPVFMPLSSTPASSPSLGPT